MSGFSVTEEYFSGQGVCMIASRDATTGAPTGFRPLGNVPALSIKNATTTLEHKESTTGQRGTDKRLTTEIKVNLEMTMENFNSRNLALTTRGGYTDVASGSVTAEAMKAYEGLISATAHIKISAVTVKMGATTLVAYTADATPWDYKVNLETGGILFNTSAGLTSAGVPPNITYTSGEKDVTVDYTYATQVKVDAFTAGSPELYLRFEGLNTAENNDPVVVEVFKFAVDPTQDLSLISDTLQSFVLAGSVLKDDKRLTGSPYYKVTKIDEL